MLNVFVGSGEAKFEQIKKEISSAERANFSLVRKEARAATPSEIEEYISGQGLFSEKFLVFVSGLEENDELVSFIEKKWKECAESKTRFIFEALKLSKQSEKTLEEVGVLRVFKNEEIRENFFPLADAFGARDKKRAWTLLKNALEKTAPEEIHGILWWQAKGMLVARAAESASDTEMKPFVYQKMKRAAANFSEKELKEVAQALFKSYHNAHLGKGELGLLLEKFVLERL